MKILLADDHVIYREGISVWLSRVADNVQIDAVGSCDEVCDVLSSGAVYDLILLDLSMPGMRGIQGVKRVRQLTNDLLVVISAQDHPQIMRACIDYGASGYILKTSEGERIVHAIQQIMDGYCYVPIEAKKLSSMPNLTGQQVKLLPFIAEGFSNKAISQRMNLSEGTVKQYVTALLGRLEVNNRTQASIVARAMLGR